MKLAKGDDKSFFFFTSDLRDRYFVVITVRCP